jgi:hypothetical protein
MRCAYLHVDHIVDDDELHEHLSEIQWQLEDGFGEEVGGSTIWEEEIEIELYRRNGEQRVRKHVHVYCTDGLWYVLSELLKNL